MKGRRIATMVLVSAALLLLPMAASAGVFYNISGVAKGTSTFTFTNMSSTGKRVIINQKFTNGVVSPMIDNGDVLFVYNAPIFKAFLGNPLVVNYPGNTKVRLYTGYTLLLNSANSLSGIGWWDMKSPQDDYIAYHAGSGTQFVMNGACRINIAVGKSTNNVSKGVIKVNQMTPGEAFFRTFTSDGVGSVTYGDKVDTDARAAMPAITAIFTELPPFP